METADRIFLRDHVLPVEVGAFQEERGRTQRLRFDVTAAVAAAPDAVAHDDVDGVLSYDHLRLAVEEALREGRVSLLETLAERIAARVLGHACAEAVTVRIEKLDLGPYVLGVEIARRRSGAVEETGSVPRPLVAVVGWAVARATLDALAADGPAVIVVAPDAPGPDADHVLAQRRIDLLEIEQAGWRLAARDPRCVVVDSRTEIAHALRTRPLTIWAPSRLVLSATDPPEDVAPATLARWLGPRLDAREVR